MNLSFNSFARKGDEKYLDLEDYWNDQFSIIWHNGRKRYDITNGTNGSSTYSRCMVKSFKICYLAKQYINQMTLDEAPSDLLLQVADLLGITIVELINRR